MRVQLHKLPFACVRVCMSSHKPHLLAVAIATKVRMEIHIVDIDSGGVCLQVIPVRTGGFYIKEMIVLHNDLIVCNRKDRLELFCKHDALMRHYHTYTRTQIQLHTLCMMCTMPIHMIIVSVFRVHSLTGVKSGRIGLRVQSENGDIECMRVYSRADAIPPAPTDEQHSRSHSHLNICSHHYSIVSRILHPQNTRSQSHMPVHNTAEHTCADELLVTLTSTGKVKIYSALDLRFCILRFGYLGRYISITDSSNNVAVLNIHSRNHAFTCILSHSQHTLPPTGMKLHYLPYRAYACVCV